MVIVVTVTAFVWVAVVFSNRSNIFKCMLCDQGGGGGGGGGGDGGGVGGGDGGVGGGQDKSHHNHY